MFFNPGISNQMSLIVNSIDNSGVAGEKQGKDFSLIINVNNWVNKRISKRYMQFPVLVSDCFSDRF